MRVVLWNPVWELSCKACETYLVTPDGQPQRDPHTGEFYLRGVLETPCESCPKVPTWAKAAGRDVKDMRALAHELSAPNRKALDFYRRCKAVGRFPDDPLVAWYSGLIHRAESEVAAQRADATAQTISESFTGLVELLIRMRR